MAASEETPSAAPKACARNALVVVGCHRSGTSAMARALSLCGAELPSAMWGATAGNPKGHWEPKEVTLLNDRLLSSLGARWDSPFGPDLSLLDQERSDAAVAAARAVIRDSYQRDLIVFKDPRVSLLLPIWRSALEQEGYALRPVVMVRDPQDVAESLHARDALPREHGLILWLTHVLTLEEALGDLPRCYVSYPDFSYSAEDQLDRIDRTFGVLRRTWGSLLDVEGFVDPAREPSRPGAPERLIHAVPEIARYHAHLLRLACDQPSDVAEVRRATAWWRLQAALYAPTLRKMEADLRACRRQLGQET